MKIMENGVYREATPEEMSAIERECARAETAERKRPYTPDEVLRLIAGLQINNLSVDDDTALRMISYYPEWGPGQAYAVDYKVQHQDRLF